MSRREPTLASLPTETELFWAPERAILAALDVSLVLSIRALKAAHPMLEDPDEAPDGHEPLLLIGESLLATARSLHELIAGYDNLVGHLTRLDSSHAAAAPPTPASADCTPEDDDIPF
jgi:hypothetical protein